MYTSWISPWINCWTRPSLPRRKGETSEPGRAMESLDCEKGGIGSCHRTGQSHCRSYCLTHTGGSGKQWSTSILLLLKGLPLVVDHLTVFVLLLDISLWKNSSGEKAIISAKHNKVLQNKANMTCCTYMCIPEKPVSQIITCQCALIISLCHFKVMLQ